MSVAQHSGTARPVRATLPCFANRVSAWPSRRNQPRVCKTLPSDSYSVSFGTQSGPTVSSNLNAGLLVPSQTSPSLWFRTRFPGKSHNHTAVDPATTQVFINHIGSANNTWVATNTKRFGRGRHSATAPEPTDRRGVGPWGETAGRSIGNVSLRIFVPWNPRKTGAGTRRKSTGTRRNRRVQWNKRARCGIALMMVRRKSILPKEQ